MVLEIQAREINSYSNGIYSLIERLCTYYKHDIGCKKRSTRCYSDELGDFLVLSSKKVESGKISRN